MSHEWDTIFGDTVAEITACDCPVRIAREDRCLLMEFGPPVGVRFNVDWVPEDQRTWLAQVLARSFMEVRKGAVEEFKSETTRLAGKIAKLFREPL